MAYYPPDILCVELQGCESGGRGASITADFPRTRLFGQHL